MIHQFTARSKEWLEFRKNYITATEAPSLLGLNDYLSLNQLVRQKNSDNMDSIDNAHMRDGRAAEGAAVILLEEMGWAVSSMAPKGKVLVYTDPKNLFSATPDFYKLYDHHPLSECLKAITAVIEIKKTTEHGFVKNWVGSTPPLRYLTQVQLQMFTSGIGSGYLCCVMFADDMPISIYEIRPNQEFIDLVTQEAERFRTLKPDKMHRVSSSLREKAIELLLSSYRYVGTFRFDGKTEHVDEKELEHELEERRLEGDM